VDQLLAHGFHETSPSECMAAHKSLSNAVVLTEPINSRKTSHWIHQEEASLLGGKAHFDLGTFFTTVVVLYPSLFWCLPNISPETSVPDLDRLARRR